MYFGHSMALEVILGFGVCLIGFGQLYLWNRFNEINQEIKDLMSVTRVIRHHLMQRMHEEEER